MSQVKYESDGDIDITNIDERTISQVKYESDGDIHDLPFAGCASGCINV